ncbi:MAG: hypothetical protein HZA93_29260 [Verrucomicrobia bacterium]|nr:hypothetical protein [Verrucomicrobiota bacterium]
MSAITWSMLERLPLMVAHALLAAAEREIDEIVHKRGGEWPAKWEAVRTPDDVLSIYCVDQETRTRYRALALHCIRREEKEIAALRAGRAA